MTPIADSWARPFNPSAQSYNCSCQKSPGCTPGTMTKAIQISGYSSGCPAFLMGIWIEKTERSGLNYGDFRRVAWPGSYAKFQSASPKY